MSWNKITGQSRVKKILGRAISENRIPGAYLFWGEDGVGKEVTALEFAKTVNCESPVDNNGLPESCGSCPSCIAADKFNHSNIKLVYSLPPGKKSDSKSVDPIKNLSNDQIEIIREQLQLKSEDNYHKLNIPNAKQIKIASIREVKRSLSLTAGKRGRRAVIVFKADEMTNESANAFLKTLEEPNNLITIILITSRPDKLLSTILSRCQQIRFEPLEKSDIIKHLMAKYEINEQKAGLISEFSRGSLTAANDFLDDDMQQLRMDMVDLLRTSLKKSNFRLELAEKIENLLRYNDKNYLVKSLSLLLLWLKDAFIFSISVKTDMITNRDQIEIINNFTKKFGKKDIGSALKSIESALVSIPKNINPQLVLTTLFIELRHILLD